MLKIARMIAVIARVIYVFCKKVVSASDKNKKDNETKA